jgi:transcriptional regulator NrdR family protein
MPLSDHRRLKLVRSLDELRNDRPIDNPQIARALVALIEAVLDETGERSLPSDRLDLRLTRVDLGR